jgi:hypothetical protein
MKKNLSLFLVIAVLTVFAFRDRPAAKTTTYGICDCVKKSSSGPNFTLTIAEDHTFRYVSTMDPKSRIDITGTWEMEGERIRLKDYPAGSAIHDKWKLEHKFPCITSRRGLEFSRLCEVECDQDVRTTSR